MSDALYNAILGDQPSKGTAPPPAPPKTGGTNQFNVGNLRPVGQSTGFQQPASYEEGIRAMDENLKVYGTKHKINTLRGVISRYAPASENDTEGYINFIAQRTGLKPDQEIDLTNPAVRHVISGPMILMEKGGKAIFGAPTQQKAETQAAVSEDPLYNAILGTKPKQAPVSQQDIEKATTIRSGFPEEDLSRPVTVNRRLARQGEKMREQGSKLQPFVQEVAKPLEEITKEDYAKSSTPAIWAKLTVGNNKQKQEALDAIYSGSQKVVKGVTDFANAPNKGEIIQNALSEIVNNPAKFIGESVKSVVYHPEQIVVGNVAGKAIGDVAGKAITGTKNIAEKVAETPVYQGLAAKAKSAAETMQEGFQAYKQAQAPQAGVVPAGASVGAAQTANKSIIDEALTRASPALAQELSKLDPKDVNIEVLNRHLDADTLPIPIQLSEGQATRSPQLFSDEMNSRGKNKELANRYNDQNKQLVENIDQIKENAAPRVYGTNVVENGQSLIDSYLDIDKARLVNIDAKYKALRDAAGGDFPIDGVKFADNALNSLKKNLKTEFLPDSIRRQIDGFKRGEPMTYEQFEAMRTNLAAEMRKADRAGDGNTEFALGKVREALDDLPLTNETKELKILADEARAAAKERFDTLDKDKAYKAAVNGKVAADDFINKFVIGGKKADIDTMVSHLGADSQAREVMAAGIVNWLKSKSGISADGQGTFSQKGYNKALESIDPKILNIVGAEVNKQLKALGNTARNIQERPVGGYVNESNTLVGAIAEKAKGGVEFGLNLVGGGQYGLPLGTMARGAVRNVQEAKKIRESLKPGAGIKLKDIGKE
jgi:hypothetical protein